MRPSSACVPCAYHRQANWKLWPFANLVNFAFVPLQLRVLFGNVVSIGWSIYVSAAANKSSA
jgi:hypothetical protein